jgi:Skp family chaperone for outer membrane proteins
MIMRSHSLYAALAALTLAAAPAADAQTAPAPAAPAAAAAAPTANPNGPLITGVCLLSQDTLIGRSRVGQAATARLRELAGQVQSNLNAEAAQLDARAKTLEAKRATLTPLQLEAQGQALNKRAQALQAERQERAQQIDATKNKAFGQVVEEARPFIAQAYAAHGCGLLLAREAALAGNFGNDLTPEVVAALDAKGTPVAVELVQPQAAK